MKLENSSDVQIRLDMTQWNVDKKHDLNTIPSQFKDLVQRLLDNAWNGTKVKSTLIIEDTESGLSMKFPVFPCKVNDLEEDHMKQTVHTEWVCRGNVTLEKGKLK